MTLRRRQLLSIAGAAGLGWLGSRLPFANAALAGADPGSAALAAAGAGAIGALPRGDQRIALISDLNSSYGSTSYVPQVQRGVQLLQQLRVDLVLCAGDMVAGQKRGLSGAQLDGMWASFERQVLQPLRNAGEPFAPAMGNHDASSSRGAGGYLFALERERAAQFWRQRRDGLGLQFVDGSGFPFRYSIRQGEVFVVVIDASAAAVSEADWTWVESQCASPPARQARLRLLMGHLPAYGLSQGRDRPGEVLQQPDRLRQVMQRHGLHLYVSGHQHAWYPARVGSTNLLGLGAMGSGPRQLVGDSQPPQQTLTLLDLFRERNLLVETTIDLNRLRPLPVSSRPATLQPRTGPQLQRREGRTNLS
jgi:hypothetical protein